jgi:hypothetical protein
MSAAAAASSAVVPVLVAALATGGWPAPAGGESPTVRAVVTNGPLGYVEEADEPFDALDGAHPVTRVAGPGVAVRPAVARQGPPGPDVSDTALPARVLAAYKDAATSLADSDPGCRLTWPLLAGIGKVESGHAYGGAVDRTGDTLVPILGPVLDGGPGVAAIPDTDDGRWDTDTTWDRAVGPMQFIPSSWQVHGADGNGDGRRDPNNVVDASLASGGYLCSGDRDLKVTKDRRAAVFSYNHSWDYVDLVLAWAEAYAGGTPVLTGTLARAAERSGRPDRRSGPGAGSGAEDAAPVATGPGPAPRPGGGGGSAGPEPAPAPPPGPSAAATATTTSSNQPSPGNTTAPPSPDPTPTPTACPSGEPSPTATPGGGTTPDPTPSPTPTPDPTGSPTPSASPDACAEPTPAATASP